nr:nucleoside-diphosphate sugar epimerase/dehydratase [Novosphingobium jiangmenense]
MILVISVAGITGIPRATGIIGPLILAALLICSRATVQFLLGTVSNPRFESEGMAKALIYGAGATGVQLLTGLGRKSGYDVIGFIDDDANLVGRRVSGLPVFKTARLARLCREHDISIVLLALPGVSNERRAAIVAMLKEQGLIVRTIPLMSDLVSGRVAVTDLREVSIGELLGREPVHPDPALLRGTVDGKTLLVTGAGGSIGSELCRQLLAGQPRTLVIVDHSEFALYSIKEELSRLAPAALEVIAFLGSVTDSSRMRQIFSDCRPDTVYHAAAYKHVPLVEDNICEAVRNNVFGTLVVSRLAIEFGASNFVLVSTDKAVRPTSVMGASKRLAELVLQALSEASGACRMSMVRFGNVLGSSGSVIPLFQRQIRAGGPLTVTHEEMTRYFMTVPEAAQLILQSGTMADGGDVFLLDMGEPMRIMDLARSMIELSGLRVYDEATQEGDIAIEVTGLRPGEKLYEELLIDAEAVATSHPRIFRAQECFVPWHNLEPVLTKLHAAISGDDDVAVLRCLEKSVTGFRRKTHDGVPPDTIVSPALSAGYTWYQDGLVGLA